MIVTRTTKRYWSALALGLAPILGWVLAFDWLVAVEAPQWAREAFLVIGLAAFVGFLVAREKGRSMVWVAVVLFIAPLLLVLLLIPHGEWRRAALNGAGVSQ